MTDTTKLPTPHEAAARVDEADGDTSGRGLKEVSALLRSMAVRVDELEHRVLAHEKLQARIVQALGRETWQGDLAAAVEADVARANANAESCKQFSDRLRDIVTALDHGLSQRAREAAKLALRMPWLSGSSVPSTSPLSPPANGLPTLDEYRNTTIEECAKIAELHSTGIAENIRALTTASPDREAK